jgi:hypothetical protein
MPRPLFLTTFSNKKERELLGEMADSKTGTENCMRK